MRLELSRLLLAAGREHEARPHLVLLADQGIAEGAFHLGTIAKSRGHKAEALTWFKRGLDLNPGHEKTLAELAQIEP